MPSSTHYLRETTVFELESLQNNIVAVAGIAVAIGLLIGWLVTYLFIGRGPSKTELTGKLHAVEEEFETHKENVDKHFETTSELVNELTESYVKVYKHLSEGAEQLGGVVDMRNRLTLDKDDRDSDRPTKEPLDETADGKIIEGALATATVAQADDADFTVSDAAVEETLTELEQNQTTSETIAAEKSLDSGSTSKSSTSKNSTSKSNAAAKPNKKTSRKKRKARNKHSKT